MKDDSHELVGRWPSKWPFAGSYRFEMTEDYLALIAQVEALPQNRPGADKSWVRRLIDSSARFYKSAVHVR